MGIRAQHFTRSIPIALLLLIVCIDPLQSQTAGNVPAGYDRADMRIGGLLYDNWVEVRNVDLKETHPLYPRQGNMSGSFTWRCKECHGWDYLGKDGSFGKGFFFTGIKGVFDARSKTPDELFAVLTDKPGSHDFSLYLSHADIWSLVKFIREGLNDVRNVINPDGSVNGDPALGEKLYLFNCQECHGSRGNLFYIKEYMEGAHGVGWEANRNPAEVLHKVLYGHVNMRMPSVWQYNKLTFKETVDILSYCQTLFPE